MKAPLRNSQDSCAGDHLVSELGLDFGWDEISAAREQQRLLSLDLELSRRCNFRCVYCYASSGTALPREMTTCDITGVIGQACRLGARRVIIVGGGEPTLYPELERVIEAIGEHGASAVVFSNGTGVTPELAQFLYQRSVGIVLKLSSLNSDVQDELCGHRGASRIVAAAMRCLLAAGYEGSGLLGIATVVCTKNVGEIESIWRWARDRGVVPYVETLTPQGRGREDKLAVSSSELGRLYERLAELDVSLGLPAWEPHPPFAGMSCHRHLYSCYIRADGAVQPCSGIDITVGSVQTKPLSEIVRTSPVLGALRYAERNVSGRCAECELNPDCYGCRGSAFQVTGDYLAADPTCWR